MVDRVRNTSVLCYSLVVKVNYAVLVNCYILKQSVSSDCVVNVRLRLLVKVNNLCIAAALKVKHAVVVPAVLVVADKQSLRIC